MRKFLIFVSVVVAMVAVSADDLATVFATPPKTARPETWFHLINGNISKEGLSADLEAISAAGISGIQLFHGSRGSTKPWPGVTNSVACLSPQWEDHILHAANECRRLGLTYRMQNCPGWSMSGGPWIRSGQAMRRLVTSRAYVQGGKTVKTRLALRGPNVKGIATLAFRCPAGDVNPFTKEPGFLKPVAVTGGGTLANAWRDLFLKDKAFGLPAGNWTVELDFGKPVMLRTLETPGVRSMSYDKCYSDGVLLSAVRIEPDGQETKLGSWRNPRSNWQDRGCWSIALADDKPTRKLRLTIETQYVIKLSRFTFLSQAHPDNFEGVSGRTLRSLVRREHATLDPAACVNPAEVIDLTAMTDAQGNVTWNDAPAGDWLIFRLGHARENKCIYPAPPGATGFECDKLSPHGIETTFAGYIGHLTDPKTGVLRGGLLKGAIFDSWECETQNWTPGLDAAFEKHYGYKLLPWMPAVLGYVVKDRESTDRFLRDWRVFLGDCIEKNFFGRFAQLCHARGLDASFETAFGDVVPGDILGYYRYCDVPMCEYWQPKHAKLVGDSETKDVRPTVSAAKMYGKRRVAAEAFTSGNLTWNEHPRFFKSYHDEHYALGVTHPVFHTYTHHPQTDGFKRPGTSFGGNIGSPFLRGQTWWRHMASFTEYIARCTALAEAGDTVADVLYYLGDEANAKPPFTLADLPPTYHYDYCNQDALLNRIAVKDGKWVLPEGGAYAVLWLPDCKRLMPETLEKIRAGVKQGARVCGRRPDAPATLAGGAALEAKFAELRDAIWGGAFADRVSEGAITAALTAAGCSPDVTVTTADGRDWSQRTRDGKEGLAWSHRVAKGRHWYFFAAPAERSFAGTVKLRGGATRRFAFWDATTGRRTAATTKPLPDGSVEIALNLGASESVFVVEVADGAPAPTTVDALTETTLTAPWRVTFEKGWGRDEPIEMTQLAAWCDLPGDDEAKAYSGTATYATTFTLERTGGRLVLDLGRVEMIAAVRVNGKAAGTLWTWPYRVDVTDLVTSGVNTLEIDVISTWYNRLAYDESLPVAQRKTWSRNVPKADSARVPYGLLGPVTFHSADRISLSAGATSVDETRLLQGEIDRLAAAGGGTLRVQPGVHRSGALFFKPGVNLHLEKGAVIQGVDEAAAYPWRETRMIGMTLNYFPALINADRCDGFTITGEGVIDGHGLPVWKAFWPRYHAAQAKKKPWDDVFNGLTRPRVLYVSNSRNVDVSGVTFKNSKFWTTHYYRCANVTVHDCRIVAEKLDGVMGPSTDAIDIDVCTNIVVRRVYMDVKDDAVVVKGGRGPDANKVEKGNGETVNVLVEDCTFGPLCHACLTLGSECPAARNIRMRNCRVEGANALARVKMRGDTPQHLTDFVVENCTGRCDRFLMFGAFAASEHWPEFRRRPLPSVMDRLELRGNKIDCRVKYDCHAVPWLTLKEYIEEDNAVNARYKGNPGCTRGARCRGSSARTPVRQGGHHRRGRHHGLEEARGRTLGGEASL